MNRKHKLKLMGNYRKGTTSSYFTGPLKHGKVLWQ